MADFSDFWVNFLPIEAWRYYYLDSSTFDSGDGRCCDAPSENVAALVVYHAGNRKTVVQNFDEYQSHGCTCVKQGGQLGEVNCLDWKQMVTEIASDEARP